MISTAATPSATIANATAMVPAGDPLPVAWRTGAPEASSDDRPWVDDVASVEVAGDAAPAAVDVVDEPASDAPLPAAAPVEPDVDPAADAPAAAPGLAAPAALLAPDPPAGGAGRRCRRRRVGGHGPDAGERGTGLARAVLPLDEAPARRPHRRGRRSSRVRRSSRSRPSRRASSSSTGSHRAVYAAPGCRVAVDGAQQAGVAPPQRVMGGEQQIRARLARPHQPGRPSRASRSARSRHRARCRSRPRARRATSRRPRTTHARAWPPAPSRPSGPPTAVGPASASTTTTNATSADATARSRLRGAGGAGAGGTRLLSGGRRARRAGVHPRTRSAREGDTIPSSRVRSPSTAAWSS